MIKATLLFVLIIIAIENAFGKKSKENLMPMPIDNIGITYADIE